MNLYIYNIMDNIIDNTQFFSGTKPNLINEKALKSINKILDTSTIQNQETTGEHLYKLYDNYVKPNMFGLLVIVIVSLFLFIRYIIKKYNQSVQIDNEIENDFEQSDSDNDNKKNNFADSDKFTLGSTNSSIKNIKKKDNDDDDVNKDTDKDSVNDGSRFTELNEEYNKAVRENIGQMSEEMIKDIYKKKKDKLSFDELTRIIVEGGN
jgi:hypothetical protein